MAGWERDAASIILWRTDLDMDHAVDPSVQQHINVSNFEVHLPHPCRRPRRLTLLRTGQIRCQGLRRLHLGEVDLSVQGQFRT